MQRLFRKMFSRSDNHKCSSIIKRKPFTLKNTSDDSYQRFALSSSRKSNLLKNHLGAFIDIWTLKWFIQFTLRMISLICCPQTVETIGSLSCTFCDTSTTTSSLDCLCVSCHQAAEANGLNWSRHWETQRAKSQLRECQWRHFQCKGECEH